MAAPLESAVMAIVPLPDGTVLLPGIVQRIPVSAHRADLIAIISSVYTRTSVQDSIDSVSIACIPIASPLVGRGGQRLILGTDQTDDQAQRPIDYSKLKRADLYTHGVSAKITGLEGRGNSEFSLLVEGQTRVKVEKVYQERPHFEGKVTVHHDEILLDEHLEDRFQHLKALSRELVNLIRLSSLMSRSARSPLLLRRLDAFISKKQVADAGAFADFMANIVDCAYEDKLHVLGLFDVKERVNKVIELLERHISGIKNPVRITAIATTAPLLFPMSDMPDPSPARRQPGNPLLAPFFTPPALNGMPGRNPGDQEPDEAEELQRKLEEARLSPEAAKVAAREMKRLKKMVPAQAEYSVLRTYLETLAEIPWSNVTDDRLDRTALARARKQLDDDHYGLDKVKQRLIEYLAVLRLKQSANEDIDAQISKIQETLAQPAEAEAGKDDAATDPGATGAAQGSMDALQARIDLLKGQRMVDKSPILLLAGPPGVGKTSLAKSVATALGRKFHRISLGGVRDEAEIRGHRRTYVAAMPGLVIQGLKKVGVANPVILLDEIDKIGHSTNHGDPSAAMLEVLDPEQNSTFTDHYVNIPVDLSKVLFIATANSLDTIPPPLLDRMEMIYLPGYTTLEKRHIANEHLIPKQVRVNGLAPDQVVFSPEVVSKIIECYTREAGVRNLEREIGSVCRAKAVEYADAKDGGKLESYRPQLTTDDIERVLGIEKFEDELAEQTSRPGVVTGLVAYSTGGNGSILFIEVADMPGNGTLQLTGTLGDVLKESVEVALTWVKAHAYELGLAADPAENIMKNRSIHVHCPAGAIPKDGPSSGLAQAIALISLFSGKPVPPTIAMTGEISLRGRVTAVGGIKEKLIGALRAGVKTVLLPAQNVKDTKDLPQEVKDGLIIIHASHIWEAIRHVWPEAHFPGEPKYPGIQERL
ncbi:hypothetical protein RB595_006510 [Gaeumannomyces hyphopodioides]